METLMVWLGLGGWGSHCLAHFPLRPSARPPADKCLSQAINPTSFVLEPFRSLAPCSLVSCQYTLHLSAKDNWDTPVTWIHPQQAGSQDCLCMCILYLPATSENMKVNICNIYIVKVSLRLLPLNYFFFNWMP